MSEVLCLSLLSGLATGLGGLLIVALGKPKQTKLTVFLAFTTGIMIAVIVFDLLPTAFMFGGLEPTGLGFITGLAVLAILNATLNLVIGSDSDLGKDYLRLGYLIALGIALHDLPEGLAISVSYDAQTRLGLVLAFAIALHNIPEGMATAAPLKLSGMTNTKILVISLLISFFTPLGAYLGSKFCQNSDNLIALLLALAAGAMTYIIKDELLPFFLGEHPLKALVALASGFVLIFMVTFINV